MGGGGAGVGRFIFQIFWKFAGVTETRGDKILNIFGPKVSLSFRLCIFNSKLTVFEILSK